MDVVYVVGPWDHNEELRFSLRSLAAHVSHDRVWIVGHLPPWVTGVHHIPTAQTGTRFQNSTRNMRAAVDHPDVSRVFMYFNDDFFALEPLDGVPVRHRGLLDDVIAATDHSDYRAGAMMTRHLLRQFGIERALSYELHMPMPVDKATMRLTLSMGAHLRTLHKRTLYGNLAEIGGTQATDCKVRALDQDIPAGPWVSTTDDSFRRGRVGAQIRARFPDPCRYEREGA